MVENRYTLTKSSIKYFENALDELSLVTDNSSTNTKEISNNLAFIFEHYANKLIDSARDECTSYFPKEDGKIQPQIYYWARTATCSNRSCGIEVPLIKQPYLSQRRNTSSAEWVYFEPVVASESIELEIKKGRCESEGWVKRGNLTCPACGNITEVNKLKQQFVNGQTGHKMIAVIEKDKKGNRNYRLPNAVDLGFRDNIPSDNIFQVVSYLLSIRKPCQYALGALKDGRSFLHHVNWLF